MAKTVEVDLNINNNIEPTIANLKRLKKQLKDTAAGSDEFNRLSAQIRDLDDAIKDASATSDDFLGYLENASGPLGILGQGIRNAEKTFSSFNGVLKASVIGLIVGLISGLVAAFNDNEKAVKKLQPLLIGMEKIFNGIYAIVEPLFNIMVDLAIKALPLVSQAFAVIYSSVAAVVQSLGSLGQAVYKFVTGDFAGAWESAKSSVTDFGKNYDDSIARFEEGTKRLTKTEIENSTKRVDNTKSEIDEKARLQAEANKKAYEGLEEYFKSLKDLEQRYFDEQQDMLADNDQKKLDLWFIRRAQEIDEITKDEAVKTNLYLQLNKQRQYKQVEIDKKATLERIDQLQAYANASMAVSQLLGQQTVEGKALAIAASLISTYAAIAKQLEAFSGVPVPGYAIAEAIATGAVGFAQVANIASVNIGGGSGSGGEASKGMSAPPAPRFNVVGASGINQVAQSIGNQSNQPIKAYVVSKDITTAQSLDRNIVSSASM
jgi:hypothetical protein